MQAQTYCYSEFQYLFLLYPYFSDEAILAEFHGDLFFPLMGFADQEYSCLESAPWKACDLSAFFTLACGNTHFDCFGANDFGRAWLRSQTSSVSLLTCPQRYFAFCVSANDVFLAVSLAQYALASMSISGLS